MDYVNEYNNQLKP